jgi:hypothetical protein
MHSAWTGETPVPTRAVPTRAFETNYTIKLRVRIASGPVPDLLKEDHHVIE